MHGWGRVMLRLDDDLGVPGGVGMCERSAAERMTVNNVSIKHLASIIIRGGPG